MSEKKAKVCASDQRIYAANNEDDRQLWWEQLWLEVEKLDNENVDLKRKLHDASKAGTPYYRERDTMNALVVANRDLDLNLKKILAYSGGQSKTILELKEALEGWKKNACDCEIRQSIVDCLKANIKEKDKKIIQLRKQRNLEMELKREAMKREEYQGECHAPNCKNDKIGFSKYCPEHYNETSPAFKSLTSKLERVVNWLEANQQDVFSRGLWDAISTPREKEEDDGK